MSNLDLSPYENAKLKDILSRKFIPVMHENFKKVNFEEYALTENIPKTAVNNKLFIKIYNKKTAKLRIKEVLTREQEEVMFSIFNFCKLKINKLKRETLTKNSVKLLFKWYDRMQEVKEQIVQFNVRLVFLMVRKFQKSQIEIDDLVSNGNESILKAIEQFNQQTNNKFSTYLYRSIHNNFLKLIKKYENSNRKMKPMSLDETLITKGDIAKAEKTDDYNLKVLRYVLKYNKANLNKIEMDIINQRYPINENGDFKPARLEDLGVKWKKNKNTVASMEKKVMDKIYIRMQDYMK
jgi:RNA polymerase sigma factor (sigma-70 family)